MKKALLSSLFAVSVLVNNPVSAQVTFLYTGSSQTYVVPLNVSILQVDVRGARGGDGINPNGGNGIGGNGGQVTATIMVTSGETLTVNVGGMGQVGSPGGGLGGFNGGGNGEDQYQPAVWMGGGGGGASDIRQGGITLADRVIVAGGGGGGGSNCAISNGNAAGQGGGLTGGDGISCTSNGHGLGGTPSAGGAGGLYQWDCGSGGPAASGVSGVGGDADVCSAGGGGGGGYYGGGGGDFGGAGGGNSYTIISATGVVHTQGQNPNDGIVVITPISVGIPGFESMYVLIETFPNPAKDILLVRIDHAKGPLLASFKTVTGQLLRQCDLFNGDNEVRVDEFSAGTYFLFVSDNEGNKTSRMLVKE